MDKDQARQKARMVEVCLTRGNFDAARAVIDVAEQQQRAKRNPSLVPFEELGLNPRLASILNDAGLYFPADIQRETLSSLREIDGISFRYAKEIVDMMERVCAVETL